MGSNTSRPKFVCISTRVHHRLPEPHIEALADFPAGSSVATT
jgi:hypothetical protein